MYVCMYVGMYVCNPLISRNVRPTSDSAHELDLQIMWMELAIELDIQIIGMGLVMELDLQIIRM